jgi:hypothetical protein
LDDMHEVHVFAGKVVGFEVISHSFWHLLRWGLAGEIQLLWTHVTGFTGLIALLVTPLIVWPMLFQKLRKKIPFEWRKAAHYLSIVWGVAICFHAPKRYIHYIMGGAVGVYALDWAYGFFFQIHRLESLSFQRLGSAVEIQFEHPKGFRSDGAGYVYICLPWISKTEWHAFSLVELPTQEGSPRKSAVCMAVVGDWTSKVHAQITKHLLSRPGWVYGPFPSPFSTASSYSKLITVASGIGITPSVSAIDHLAKDRKVNLIWCCRDADLIEFYMRHSNTPFGVDAWSFIFYTGKRKLVLGPKPANRRIKIISGRFDSLEALVVAIIDHDEYGKPMPPELMKRAAESERVFYDKSTTRHVCDVLERALEAHSYDEIFDMALKRSADVDGLPPREVDLAGLVEILRRMEGSAAGSSSLTDAQLGEHLTSQLKWFDGKARVNCEELKKMISTLLEAHPSEGHDGEDVEPPHLMKKGTMKATMKSLLKGKGKMKGTMKGTMKGLLKGLELKGLPSRKMRVVAAVERRSLADAKTKAERKCIVDGWQMMYCGGAKPVVDSLEAIHEKYGLPLRVESFAW